MPGERLVSTDCLNRIDLPLEVNNRAFFFFFFPNLSTTSKWRLKAQLIVGEISGAGSGAGKWLVAEPK